jgi:hypothetical protein
MAELAALVLVITDVVLGARGVPWPWVFLLGLIGAVVYWWMRSAHIAMMFERGREGFATWLVTIYLTQLATAAVLFGIGRGIGILF